jgi:hypothetical protein
MRNRAVALLLSLSLLPVAVMAAQLPPGTIKTVGIAHSHSVSLPLGRMTTCSGASAVTAPEVEARLPPTIVDFEGIDQGQLAGGCSLFPIASDDSGAVGPHHFVQVVNIALAVYDKTGKRLAGPISTTTFWANQPDCGGFQFWSDSVVIYDRQADRWVISRPGRLPNGADLCLAVSQTADPTGRWDQYAFEVNNKNNGLDKFFDDYPKIGAWPGSYFATADPNKIFSGLGNTITAFDRAAMLAGEAKPAYVTFFVPAPRPRTGVAHSHMLPAQLDGKTPPPAKAPGYIVQVQDRHWGFPAGRLQLYEFSVDWADPSAATLTPTVSLSPEPFDTNACPWNNGVGQSCIVQPVGPALDSLAYGYMMFRLVYRNFGAYQSLLLNHTVAADGNPSHDHAGIRWYELRRGLKSQWSIHQQGTYAPDANDRWLGSIAMDRVGDIALGFDVSGPGKYPSIRYTGRTPGDPPGRLPRGEVSIVEGRGAQLGFTSFGDYSQMTVDPTDDCTFWYTNTYYPKTTTVDIWHTRIAAFKFPNCR